jgi:uncharacterized protein (UPF0332 family)
VFDWYDYLDVAQEWVAHDDEAYQRSAVSRAYYAMYCNARNRLSLTGEFDPPRCGSDHTHVWNTFGRGPEDERVRIGELGHRLREARRQADYENEIPNLPSVVGGAMRIADDLRTELQRL